MNQHFASWLSSLRHMVLVVGISAAFSHPALANNPAPVPPCGLYLYKADITRIIDGDTVVADSDGEQVGGYGRYLVDIYVDSDSQNLNDWMVEQGFARLYAE